MGEIQIPAANLLQPLGKGTDWTVLALFTGSHHLVARLVRAREQKSGERGSHPAHLFEQAAAASEVVLWPGRGCKVHT